MLRVFSKAALSLSGLVVIGMVVSCEKQSSPPQTDPALVQRALDLQREVYALQRERLALEQDASQAAPLREQMAKMMTELEQMKLQRDQSQENLASLQKDYDDLVAQLKPINDLLSAYEDKLRENLKSLPLGNIETRDGRSFEEVNVAEVGNDWVKLNHSGGNTIVEISLLPDDLQEKFSFRPAMVSADSLLAQQPVKQTSDRPVYTREDAAKAMERAMAAERARAEKKLQDGYVAEIAQISGELTALKSKIKRLEDLKSQKRREMNKPRKIKIADADKKKAMVQFDFQIQTVQREIAQREARVQALQGMLKKPEKK